MHFACLFRLCILAYLFLFAGNLPIALGEGGAFVGVVWSGLLRDEGIFYIIFEVVRFRRERISVLGPITNLFVSL